MAYKQEEVLAAAARAALLPRPAPATAQTAAAPSPSWPAPARSMDELLADATVFADELASRPNVGGIVAPLAELQRCAELGFLTAPLPRRLGGLGLGTERGSFAPLLRLFSLLGGADLALGRLYEGHVNALLLLATYGTEEQLARAAQDAHDDLLFGVWNTGEKEPVRIAAAPGLFTLHGVKTFATGADFVRRPIVTGERPGAGWQMALLRTEAPEVARCLRIDRSFWHPLGMESSESYRVEFAGTPVEESDLVGQPGDFYADPIFRGGAIRFSAVQAGAVLRLHRMFADWLKAMGRGNDPYQVARLGKVAMAAQAATLWIERAAVVAETCLTRHADKLARERMLECANMTRLAIEQLATETMQRVVAGVGAHGLLQPHRFERILRDLTTYLRQPAPDATLAEVGHASLRKANLRSGGAGDGFWLDGQPRGSMPPGYFNNLYERSADPWNFETSDYEANKYADTLSSLPPGQFGTALEVGCSIGVLTAKLAPRCEHLLSIDVSDRALAVARQRCADLSQVQFARMEFPRDVPDGRFDLVVISEVAYYWQREDLERAATALAAHQRAGAHLLLVHLTEFVPDYPLTGDQVHDAWLDRPEWERVHGHRAERYRVDLLRRR